jgi:bloom syndrome protein
MNSYEVRKKSKAIKKGKNQSNPTIDEMVRLINSTYPEQSGIVYCISRNDCEYVAEELRKRGLKAAHYHAEVDPEERKLVQEQWTDDEIHIIVATIAFGMGINKVDVRFVIHYSLPKSIEGYYQESGRAGRDGQRAHCILYYTYSDKFRHEHLIEQSFKDNAITMQFKQELMNNLNYIVSYCENKVDCRRVLQLQYLGEQFDRTLCGNTCDNCMNSGKAATTETKDVTTDAIHALKLAKEMAGIGKFTMAQLVETFRGSTNKSMMNKGFHLLSMHGAGKSFSRMDADRLMKTLVEKGLLKEELERNTMGFPSVYLKIYNPDRIIRQLEQRTLTISLSFDVSKKNIKAKGKKSSLPAAGEDNAEDVSDDWSIENPILYGRLMDLRKKVKKEKK